MLKTILLVWEFTVLKMLVDSHGCLLTASYTSFAFSDQINCRLSLFLMSWCSLPWPPDWVLDREPHLCRLPRVLSPLACSCKQDWDVAGTVREITFFSPETFGPFTQYLPNSFPVVACNFILLSLLWIQLLLDSHINKFIYYLHFCVWNFSLIIL